VDDSIDENAGAEVPEAGSGVNDNTTIASANEVTLMSALADAMQN
jgi:hypothetical protein